MAREWRNAFGPFGTVLAVTLWVMATWAVFRTFGDATGRTGAGYFVWLAPVIFTLWSMLSLAWRRSVIGEDLAHRMVFSCLIAPLPIIGATGLSSLVLWIAPPSREILDAATAANHDFHYYWSLPVVQNILMQGLLSYIFSMCGALAVLLVLVLPVLSLRHPEAIMARSHILKIADPAKRRRITIAVAWGLASVILGIVLTAGVGHGIGLQDAWSWWTGGAGAGTEEPKSWRVMSWSAGWLLIVAGRWPFWLPVSPSLIGGAELGRGAAGVDRLRLVVAELGNERGAEQNAQNYEDPAAGDSPDGAQMRGDDAVEEVGQPWPANHHHEEHSLEATADVVRCRALQDRLAEG